MEAQSAVSLAELTEQVCQTCTLEGALKRPRQGEHIEDWHGEEREEVEILRGPARDNIEGLAARRSRTRSGHFPPRVLSSPAAGVGLSAGARRARPGARRGGRWCLHYRFIRFCDATINRHDAA